MVETLGQALDEGWRLHVKCGRYREGLKAVPACVGVVELSLKTLVWTHGRRCPLGYLQTHLRCPRCGSMQVTYLWTSPPGMNVSRATAG